MIPRLKYGADTSQYSVTLSAVVFFANADCAAGGACTYVAGTAWSVALPQGLQVTRPPCGIITQVTPDQQATISNLPTSGMTTLTSVLVADVSYRYQPLFSGFITGPITLQRTAYLPPRAGTPSLTHFVQYDRANASNNPAVCYLAAQAQNAG